VYRDIQEDLLTLIEPIIEDHGLELVDVERSGSGRSAGRVRVIVDTPSGDGRVAIERCAEVSREIATHLDASETIGGSYTLEVTSPGLDRVLAREKDFAAATGCEVKLETRTPLDGRRRFRGRLAGFEEGVLRIDLEGTEVAIPFAEVSRARMVYEFTRDDFARAGRSR